MKWLKIVMVFCIVCANQAFAQQQEVPYTLADRDRIIRLEAGQDGLRNEMDTKFETIEVKIQTLDAKIDYIFWLLGVLFALMLFMLGYKIWDRRTALNPIPLDVEQLKRENENMKTILRTYSEKIPQLREILRNAGIL